MPRFTLRSEDRRNLLVGFVSLAAIMTAHAMMETARDALFLARLPATQLPWAYLAIAVLAVVELKLLNKLLHYVQDRRWLLTGSLIVGSFVTFGFWMFIDSVGESALLALYVWTGLLITVLLVQFWLILDESVTVTQAKRIFAPIAAGGVVGAMAGSLIAERTLQYASPQELLLGAAMMFLVAAITPFLWERNADPTIVAPRSEREFKLLTLLKDDYFTRLLAVIFIGTLTLTALDYVFKSIVAENIPADQLGVFFARLYLFLNSFALLVQLLLAGWLLRLFGVHRSAAILPLVVVGGAIAIAVGPILLSAVALKALDGSLRHSLYKTSVEVLYLPLGEGIRARAKGLIESVGHRGAQAVASLLILFSVSLGMDMNKIGWLIGGPAVMWLFAIFLVQSGYRELFRARLRQGAIETRVELQEIDLHSLEALLLALNSDHDEEVLSAIDMFDRHNRAELLPVLILYHPSKDVKLRALEAFANAGDPRFVSVARRLTRAGHCEVESAALRAITAVAPDKELLWQARESEFPIVEATSLIGLIALDGNHDPVLQQDLDRWVNEGSPETLVELARAIQHQPDVEFSDALLRLFEHSDQGVKIATLRAMAEHPDTRYLPALTNAVGVTALRSPARRAFRAIGPDALAHLDRAMEDSALPRKVRRHLPRTISRFGTPEAAPILLRHLETERDGTVRYKILRGLGRLQASIPGLRLDKAKLHSLLIGTLERATQLLEWRAICQADEGFSTASGELLIATLREKEATALERVFRILGLLYPKENFALIWRGLKSKNVRTRAASTEVLEETLTGRERDAVIALTDSLPAALRAQAAARALGMSLSGANYADALRAMLHDPSAAVQCIAAHEIAELGLSTLAEDLRETKPAAGPVREAIDRALSLLEAAQGAPHVA